MERPNLVELKMPNLQATYPVGDPPQLASPEQVAKFVAHLPKELQGGQHIILKEMDPERMLANAALYREQKRKEEQKLREINFPWWTWVSEVFCCGPRQHSMG
ncbi:unnamed protein product [Symbiodinium sp. CCMP2592]|nr:unnamed protein product [Symbiodinium sp. CCMP2592]